ncbi:hypothetical protein R6Q59_024037 [Mikania micrantha]
MNGLDYDYRCGMDCLRMSLPDFDISAKKEAPVNFLTDLLEGRSTLRPTDILVFGWEGETLVCGPYRSVPSCWAEGYRIRGGSSCIKSGVRLQRELKANLSVEEDG